LVVFVIISLVVAIGWVESGLGIYSVPCADYTRVSITLNLS